MIVSTDQRGFDIEALLDDDRASPKDHIFGRQALADEPARTLIYVEVHDISSHSQIARDEHTHDLSLLEPQFMLKLPKVELELFAFKVSIHEPELVRSVAMEDLGEVSRDFGAPRNLDCRSPLHVLC